MTLAVQQEIGEFVKKIVTPLCSQDSVECITYLNYSEAISEPHFVLFFDVYTHEEISKVARREIFSFASMFESSRITAKDRFFVDGIPVHIDYKLCAQIDENLSSVFSSPPRYKSISTYSLWRISYAHIAYKKSDWFSIIQDKLQDLPHTFWNRQERALRAKIEHAMIDVNAAVFFRDNLVFYLTTAQLIRNICRILHTRARLFDPTERLLYKGICELKTTSQELITRIDILLDPTASLTQSQRAELLGLIVKDVI